MRANENGRVLNRGYVTITNTTGTRSSDWISDKPESYYDDSKITQRVRRANAVDRVLGVVIAEMTRMGFTPQEIGEAIGRVR